MMLIDVQCPNCSFKMYDQFVKDQNLPKCEQCGTITERLFTGFSMQPKGKGTHRSDYNSPTKGR